MLVLKIENKECQRVSTWSLIKHTTYWSAYPYTSSYFRLYYMLKLSMCSPDQSVGSLADAHVVDDPIVDAVVGQPVLRRLEQRQRFVHVRRPMPRLAVTTHGYVIVRL